MKDPFRKSEPKRTYLKIGIFGDTGTGKTIFALSAPNLAIVDAEASTTPYEKEFDFHVINSQSYKDLEEALTFLESGKHDFLTIAYDPATVLYESIIEARARFRKKGQREGDAGQMDISDWGHIKRIYKQLMVRLVNLPMNVILTFREKDKIDFKDVNNPVHLGASFDGEKSTPYYVDIWGRLVKDSKSNRVLKVIKSRYGKLQDKKILIPQTGGFDKIFAMCDVVQEGETIHYGQPDDVVDDGAQVKPDPKSAHKPVSIRRALQNKIIKLCQDKEQRSRYYVGWATENEFEGGINDLTEHEYQSFLEYLQDAIKIAKDNPFEDDDGEQFVELVGRVGNPKSKESPKGAVKKWNNFTFGVAVPVDQHQPGGEVEWKNCIAWMGKAIDLESIVQKGAKVKVIAREVENEHKGNVTLQYEVGSVEVLEEPRKKEDYAHENLGFDDEDKIYL